MIEILQLVTAKFITKCEGQSYFLWQGLLQIATGITKCDRVLLQFGGRALQSEMDLLKIYHR